MSGGSSGGRVALAMALAVAASVFGAPGASAEDDGPVQLPGSTLAARTVDVDGDPGDELVRLVREGGVNRVSVEVWTDDASGWDMVGSLPLPPPEAADPEGPIVSIGGYGLLVWNDAGGERLLAISGMVSNGTPDARSCCLTIWEVRLDRAGSLELDVLIGMPTGSGLIAGADLDGDGTDELVLHEIEWSDGQGADDATLRVLRWDGSAFDSVFDVSAEELSFGPMIGETDGIRGDEVVFGPDQNSLLRRLAWVDGDYVWHEAHVDTPRGEGGWVAAVADGTMVLALSNEIRAVRWERGADPEEIGSLPTAVYPTIGAVGRGADAVVIVQSPGAAPFGAPSTTTTVHDLALRQLGEVEQRANVELFWELFNGPAASSAVASERNLYPYSGPIEVDGGQGFVLPGALIQPGGPDGYRALPMTPLVGWQPIGLAGGDDAWVAVTAGFAAPPAYAYLTSAHMSPGWDQLVLAPVEVFFDADEPIVSFDFNRAVEVGRKAQVVDILAPADGFTATIHAAVGTTVLVLDGPIVDAYDVAEDPVDIEVEPPRGGADDTNLDWERTVLTIGVDGRGSAEQWRGTFVREAPELSVTGRTDSMALSATLSGRVDPGSAVSANGRAVDIDAEGRFETSVDAPIWPSQVAVVVRDPLGTETSQWVEVVGAVDYRGLPWAAMLVAVTVVAGAVLYVRTPKRRSVQRSAEDDGALEELDLGALEGFDTRPR